MRLTKSKKMYLAFQRAVTDLEGCVAPDPFKYCEYDYELDATIRELLDDLSHYEYRPKRAETFNMPKGELALRPGLIIHLFDLTVLHYLLSDFIFALDEKLPPGVTAYRIRKDKKNQFKIKRETAYYVLPKYRRHKIKVEEPWYNLWPEFRKQLREDLESEKFKYVACTDITAFFEDVNLNTLAEILKNKAGRYSQDINLIIEIYKSWALRDPMNVRQERGLPQSVNISGILSNYYLDVLDEFLEKERKKSQKIKWYRYCDDITILCTTKERARHLLLRIGALLRNLGLNQNARKTKILSAQEAVDELFNESADRISELISKSQKKGTNRKTLVEQLRREYKKISKKRKLDKNTETSLMRLYTASSILDVPMLINRVGSDFKRFPVRARNFSAYGRRFINYKRVLEEFRQLLHQRKRLPLFNYQLAFLVTVFRNLKKPNAGIYKAVLELCHDNKWHWFVRAQSISTLFYMGVGSVKKISIYKLLESDVKPEIRRASLILLPLFCSKKETVDILENHAKDLNVAVSRMANYLLSLINNEELAQINLKKFHGLNFVYLGDQIWRLWFIGFNSNKKIREALLRLLKRINEEYRNYSIIFLHIKTIKKRIKLDKQIENT